MKSKHYPAVTILGAVALTIIPLLLLILALNFRNRATSFPEGDLGPLSIVDDSINAPVRVADAASKEVPDPAIIRHPVSATAAGSWVPSVLPPVTTPQQAALPQSIPDVVVSDPVAASNGPESVVQSMPDRISVPAETVTEANPAFLVQTELTPAESAAQEMEQANLEIPRRPDVDKSYYAATGHMALASQPQVTDPLAQVPTPEPPQEVVSKKEPASRTRKDRSRETKDDVAEKSHVASQPRTVAAAFPELRSGSDDTDHPEDAALLEEVALQTPADGTTVGRVENVVAVTRAKGWPIALIKSDLPDDVWWVQQAVGIQGNAFAARVNFGNENSIRGTLYHMVIVFMDSPDEVRRFRIAKQFKDIPAGVRRSKEFNFVRN